MKIKLTKKEIIKSFKIRTKIPSTKIIIPKNKRKDKYKKNIN